ncbi:hypothetical protein BC835DRAFT_1298083, partial [Cytidiella melzeri]
RYSILPAMSLDGLMHMEVYNHPITGVEFADFVEGVLDWMQPWPLPNSVLVMDNASIYKVQEAFSTLKAWLRSNRDYVLGKTKGVDCDPYALIWEAAYATMTSESAYGWHKHSEYIA